MKKSKEKNEKKQRIILKKQRNIFLKSFYFCSYRIFKTSPFSNIFTMLDACVPFA